MSWLMRRWYSNHPIYLLIPFSVCYRFIISLRNFFYRHKFKKTTYLPVPVIVIGNITVGGTGKTPIVIWLANFLRQQGYQPGIISRGYGGKATHYPYRVTTASDPAKVGDEPLLIAQQTLCPVVIAPSRVAAAQELLKHSTCDIIISDDGLQHLALGRDIEIAVIDGERRFGNGFCLPAGPLREPIQRLKKVDFIVTNGTPNAGEYSMQLLPRPIYNVQNPHLVLDFKSLTDRPIHAVAAIGNPNRFFNLLKLLGLSIIEHPFPDHYLFQKHDLEFDENEMIIMTEKDAVKCRSFADLRFWCLPVRAELDDTFIQSLLTKLSRRGSPAF